MSEVSNKWQSVILTILGLLSVLFTGAFFYPQALVDKFSLFIAGIFAISLFMGLFPIRKEVYPSGTFLVYLFSGLGLIFSNNLLFFFIFWAIQRALPFLKFARDIRNQNMETGGTFIIQHILTFACFLGLLFLAYQQNYAIANFAEIPFSFFSWPVLILSFVIIYESHGIFPFHSWVHDMVGNLAWYEVSALFLTRAGVLLFVKFLLPTLSQDPDTFKTVLLALSLFSSIYWTMRGIFETNVMKIGAYFYIAQAALILSGLQANAISAQGSYLHLLVISLSGTALWSLLNYVQTYSSVKRLNQFYGLAQSYPRLATIFCLFGFCMIGVPLGASFIVEDLVINGLLSHKPFLGLLHILATGLNGILFFLVFSKLFLGQTSYPQKMKNHDMTLLQMLPYVLVLMVMFMIGILPYLFLEKLKW